MKIAYTGMHFPEKVRGGVMDFMAQKGYAADAITPKSRDAWDIREELSGYDIIICSGEKYTEATLKYLSGTEKKLKMLSRHGIGTDEIHRETATSLGIAVCNSAGTLSACVAESSLGMILAAMHKYTALDANMRKGIWGGGSYAPELRQKTVGLIGFGGIAQYLAKYLAAFECEILAYDPFFNQAAAEKFGVKQASLEEIQQKSDVISLHAPLTDETRGMIDMKFMQAMKKSAIIVNTSRGPVINEADLYEALSNGVIAGAGLDVFENEPIENDNPLLTLENVTLLPHVAARSIEGQLAAGLMACRNAIAFAEKRPPESLLNPEYAENTK
ncbi:MAG: hypothetical protein FWD23_00170 [Oscillospiraceae bacterium]|nr:hypothetical protein [Oscillospiraceae bacterium]